MSRATLRIVILLAAVSIIGIVVTQVYWVRRALDIRENQFNRDVNTALRDVASRIFEINATPSPANNPVTQVSTNYFTVMINGPIDASLLEFLLTTEFQKRNINADFEYGIYDCSNQRMLYGNYVSLGNQKKGPIDRTLPKWSDESYYFGVQFPQLQANLLSQMGIWVFSSAVLLVVILFFVYALFVILRQRRLSEIQKDFINNMTHELKTPISTIAISAQVLKDPATRESPERLANYSSIIEKENQRLKQQVERVLQIARLDREDVQLNLEQTELHALVESAIESMAFMLDESGGSIVTKLKASPTTISGDAFHLTNVLVNLLDNAIKYTKTKPAITIRTSTEGKALRIEVEDNGIGINHSDQKKVFDRFYRVPTGNVHDVKGFGLGLYYVNRIVHAHRGKIMLRSEPGKGSVFIIILPIS